MKEVKTVNAPPYYKHFSRASKQVFEALERRSTLAWPILKKQCEIAHLDPIRLKPADLKKVVPGISQALSSFTTPQNGVSFQKELLGQRQSTPPNPNDIANRLYRPTIPLSTVSSQALDILREVTPLAWPILETQCSRAGINPATLTSEELKSIAARIENAVSRLTSPLNGSRVQQKLAALTSNRQETA